MKNSPFTPSIAPCWDRFGTRQTRRPGDKRLWHKLGAQNESGRDLQEDLQSEGTATSFGAHKDGLFAALAGHRSRRCFYNL